MTTVPTSSRAARPDREHQLDVAISAGRRQLIRTRRYYNGLAKRTAIRQAELDRLKHPGIKKGGPDVSGYEPNVNWHLVAVNGWDFACVKATEGVTFTDATFGKNWAQLAGHGSIIRGAYHFGHPGRNNPEAEAAHFLKTVRAGGVHPRDILVLDLEVQHGGDVDNWVDRFLAAVASTGVTSWLYTYTAFRSWKPRPARKVWVANYSEHAKPPGGVLSKQLVLHQYTDGKFGPEPHTIPGIGACDISRLPKP